MVHLERKEDQTNNVRAIQRLRTPRGRTDDDEYT